MSGAFSNIWARLDERRGRLDNSASGVDDTDADHRASLKVGIPGEVRFGDAAELP